MTLLIIKKVMGFLFLSLILPVLSSLAAQPDAASIRTLGKSAEWKGLLQYQKSFTGAERSEVDGKSFFLSPEGKTDPVAELQSTLEAFAKPIVKDEKGEDNEHAICHFPARYEWAQKHLSLKNLPTPQCASYRTYYERIQTRKVSVVFSSYYSGSASSVFGHSFLKFSGQNDNELFDTGINFSANPSTENPILYALYGLIGVFPATFSAQPFYYKVREYNDFESRDLWTYDLNLNEAQKHQLIAHLWELGNTYYDYFYFNENCSYQILRAMEGAIPSIQFFKSRPVYLIPSESIKLLYDIPGLVENVGYRPSIRSVAYAGYEKLNDDQKNEVLQDLKHPDQISNDSKVVDVLMDAIDLNHADQIVKNDPKIVDWKESVLRKRASLEGSSASLNLPAPTSERPDQGHGSARLTLGTGVRDFSSGGSSHSEMTTDLKARASHHDLLDPSVGYPRYLHIDFGKVGFRYLHQSKRFLIDELTMVDLTALSMEHPLYKKISYDVKIGYTRKWFLDCDDVADCGVVEARAGIGKTYPLFSKHAAFFLLDFAPSYATSYHESRFKFRVTPSVNLLFEMMPNFKLMGRGSVDYVAFTEHHWLSEASLEARYVFDNRFGIGAEGSYGKQSDFTRTMATLKGLYYF